MPGKNVFEQLSQKKTPLVRRMVQSPAVTSTVMAYLNLLCGLAIREYRKPLEGIRIDAPVIDDADCFKARVHFYPIAVAGPRVWGTQSDFIAYAHAKAAHLAAALAVNPGLETFFESMVTMIERWAVSKGIPFAEIEVGGPDYLGQGPIIQRGTNMLMFKLGRKLRVERN